jgi:hypothetical protein
LTSNFAISEESLVLFDPQSWDMGQIIFLPSEGRHAVDFSNRKNPTVSVGSEPAILGTRGQHANRSRFAVGKIFVINQ